MPWKVLPLPEPIVVGSANGGRVEVPIPPDAPRDALITAVVVQHGSFEPIPPGGTLPIMAWPEDVRLADEDGDGGATRRRLAVEQVEFFDSFRVLGTDRLFLDCPPAGHKRCLCSRCGQRIPKGEPIVWSSSGGREYRYCPQCVQAG